MNLLKVKNKQVILICIILEWRTKRSYFRDSKCQKIETDRKWNKNGKLAISLRLV